VVFVVLVELTLVIEMFVVLVTLASEVVDSWF